MVIVIEVVLMLLLALIFIFREFKRRIKNYRTGDIIWVRESLFKTTKAILSNWDDFTFTYIPYDDDELKVKTWIFLARNESYYQRKNG